MSRKPKIRLKRIILTVSSYLLTFVIVAGIFWMGFVFGDKSSAYFRPGFSLENTTLNGMLNYKDCSRDDVIDAAYCLVDYVDTFYNYNATNHKKSITFEQLKEEGGVCWQWSKLYRQMAEDLGYKAKEINIWFDGYDGHTFNVIWDKNGTAYCLIDQDYVLSCVPLADPDFDIELKGGME